MAGADSEAEAAKIARSVASSSLVKAGFLNLTNLPILTLASNLLSVLLSRLLYMAEIQIGGALLLLQAMRGFLSTKTSFEYC